MKARLLLPALALIPGLLAAQDQDPPARAGRVSSVAGTVGLQSGGAPDWALAPLNYTVTSGDRLLTHQRSRAEIEVGPFDVRLSDSTDVSIVNLTDDFAQLGLTRGTLRVTVYRLASRDSMEVDTPNGAMIIRSAGKYRVDVLEGVSTIVSVEDGVVELSGPSLDYTVKRGQSIELTGTNAINASMVPHPRNTDFDQWSADRDQRQASSTYSTYMSRDIPGGADLDRNGRWDYVATYGYVWRPTIIQVGWVPYRYGRWVWTGPWGWTWVEDAPWGYAPFHYGRWVVIGNSWAWAPGPIIRRPCYAPALVVFVGGPRYHQAWFPLGWHEPYYPRYRHSDRYLREVNIANVRGIRNVNEFIDPRRADRVGYSNRQATTVTSSDVFGRRPVTNVANIRPEETRNAPIVRERWETPRTATASTFARPASEERPTSTFRPRSEGVIPAETREPVRVREPERVSEPTRAEPTESRPNSPLIFRNRPPAIGTRPSNGETLTRQAESQPGIERTRSTIQRNQPSQFPAEETAPIDRSRRGLITRANQGTPERGTAERPMTSSPSVERPTAERPSPRVFIPRESSPRVSTPRESSPRESAPRESSPRTSEPRVRAPSSMGGSQRTPSRRPPE